MRVKQSYINILIFLLGIMFILLQGYRLVLQPNFLIGQSSKLIFIAAGTSFSNLQDQLIQGNYISNPTTFRWVARLLRYDKKILPGAYRLQSGMNNFQVTKLLRAGMQEPVKIVFHHVNTPEELAEQITHNIAMNVDSFQSLLYDPQVIQQYGFTQENILTMFIPNTYYVYWTISPQALFQRLHQEYKKFWNQERLNKAQKLGLSPQQVSILASIVEKETSQLEEAPIIAGVFMNRLQKRMKLQSDPTLLYILKNTSIQRVLHEHIRIDSPYNTYLYQGLPPGPITIPSIASIDAVLNYRHHHYLYFVVKEDLSGLHYFAKSFQEHIINAQKYRKLFHQ